MDVSIERCTPEKENCVSQLEAGIRDPHTNGSDQVTMKTWAIVVVKPSLSHGSRGCSNICQVLALSYGISFWPVSFFSIIQNQLATEFGSAPQEGTWLTAVYTMGATSSFMVCGTSSDLFGRRAFILFGNALVLIGSIIGATSHSITQSAASHFILGFGAGNCMLASFALPELLPNKWKHIGVVIADAGLYFDFIAGPVVSRIAAKHHAVMSPPLITSMQNPPRLTICLISGGGATGE